MTVLRDSYDKCHRPAPPADLDDNRHAKESKQSRRLVVVQRRRDDPSPRSNGLDAADTVSAHQDILFDSPACATASSRANLSLRSANTDGRPGVAVGSSVIGRVRFAEFRGGHVAARDDDGTAVAGRLPSTLTADQRRPHQSALIVIALDLRGLEQTGFGQPQDSSGLRFGERAHQSRP